MRAGLQGGLDSASADSERGPGLCREGGSDTGTEGEECSTTCSDPGDDNGEINVLLGIVDDDCGYESKGLSVSEADDDTLDIDARYPF